MLHTLNIRLFPEQLTYIVNHADDEVIFVDRSIIALLAPLLHTFTNLKHLVLMDDGKGDIPDDLGGHTCSITKSSSQRSNLGASPRSPTNVGLQACVTPQVRPATPRVSFTHIGQRSCTQPGR